MRIENSFIPVSGVGESTERRLWERGVHTWDDFDPGVDVRGVGSTTADRIESFIADARAHLDDGDATYFDRAFPSRERWRLYEDFRAETCFFDIETTGLDERRDRVTTVSFHQDGETATLVAGDDLTADALRERFADASLLATFNGARFDVPFLETAFGIDVDTPHLDLMYPCKRLGLSGGLKPIERSLGIERDRPDITGRDAVRLWHEYERGDPDALDTLVSYNREDAVNLRTLADVVCDSLHEDVFAPAASARAGDGR
ncbi:exonuclease [Halorubrum sp. JWXQ-INN 858]|uniref:ribonuclease H-like domain-containing protein n=1 Tax=Halorubrum sp. JWXQ-INN 858 TaxID=2690782 RepID=UPI00135A1F93|nr:ribonuclease H-like domain-containing protein [Halorubrum sp. JWXQ-INN 858]MWV65765.1 exonuclease [Halorubrum sp. JWXQ-INN 858]